MYASPHSVCTYMHTHTCMHVLSVGYVTQMQDVNEWVSECACVCVCVCVCVCSATGSSLSQNNEHLCMYYVERAAWNAPCGLTKSLFCCCACFFSCSWSPPPMNGFVSCSPASKFAFWVLDYISLIAQSQAAHWLFSLHFLPNRQIYMYKWPIKFIQIWKNGQPTT